MTARLFRIILPVSDLDEAARFYGEIFEEPGERVSGGRHYFDCGGTILACYHPGPDGDGEDLPPLPDHIYFSVDDLEAYRDRVEQAGGIFGSRPVHGAPGATIARRPWGELSFYAVDPFGNRICFVQEGTEFRTAADYPEKPEG